MSPANQLSRAIGPFKQWRATRKTPEALQQQSVELRSHYSRSRVSSELGLSGTQIKHWQGSAGDAPAFVELPVLEELPLALSVELRLPNWFDARYNLNRTTALLTGFNVDVKNPFNS